MLETTSKTSGDVRQLIEAFESGTLLRPRFDVPSIVDLAMAIFNWAAVPNLTPNPNAERIADTFVTARHLVFVVIDGLGMNFINKLSEKSFLSKHVALELQTVFPSTTSTALTSLATGQWPSQHTIIGWDMYLEEINTVSTIIRFMRRSDEKSLAELGVDQRQAYPMPSLFRQIAVELVSVVPKNIAHTPYSNYWAGRNTTYVPYGKLADGIDKVVSRVRRVTERSVTYLYTASLDYASHEYGTEARQTLNALTSVDKELERLAKALPSKARVVLTADHGQINGPPHHIWPSDPLVQHLEHEPWGDSAEMHFAVKSSRVEQFESEFRERFGEFAFLLTTDEVEALELLGPGPIDEVTTKRLGTHLAISRGQSAFKYQARPVKSESKEVVGHHSGLTPDEMLVPLIVA